MSPNDKPIDESQLGWFDRAASKKLLWRLMWGICILSVVAEGVYVLAVEHRHPHFGFDGFVGYYGLFGFVACALAIGVAKIVGIWLKVKEDYYDE